MPMNPGELRHLIKLQTSGDVPDGSGGYTDGANADFAEVWARVRPLDSDERIEAMKSEADVSHEITLRYLPGVTAEMTVLYEGRTLDVVSSPIDIEGRHELIKLLCRERV